MNTRVGKNEWMGEESLCRHVVWGQFIGEAAPSMIFNGHSLIGEKNRKQRSREIQAA